MELDFITAVHKATKRNYLERMTEKKPEIVELAKKYDFDYWDGSRETGYGGFHYDGRWKPVAEKIAKYYGLKAGDKVTAMGIVGIVDTISDKTFVLKTIDGSKIEMLKMAVSAVEKPGDNSSNLK